MSQGGEITAPTAATALRWELSHISLSYFWSNWHLCNQNPSPDPVSKDWLWVFQQQNPKHRGFYCVFTQRVFISYPHWEKGSKTKGKEHPKGQRRQRAWCCMGWFSLFSSIQPGQPHLQELKRNKVCRAVIINIKYQLMHACHWKFWLFPICSHSE